MGTLAPEALDHIHLVVIVARPVTCHLGPVARDGFCVKHHLDAVLLVGDRFHPVEQLAVLLFLNETIMDTATSLEAVGARS